jgi:hypothetical protein
MAIFDHAPRKLMIQPCTSQGQIAFELFRGIAEQRKLLTDDADEHIKRIFRTQSI